MIVPAQPWSEPLRATDYGLSAQRWYAQTLTDAIYRRNWVTLRFPVDGEAPNFKTVGANRLPPARILHTTSKALPRLGIAAAHIKIGQQEYQQALKLMNREQCGRWLWHVEQQLFNEKRELLPKGAIFQATEDGRAVGGAPCHPELQRAALVVIAAAGVEPLRLVAL